MQLKEQKNPPGFSDLIRSKVRTKSFRESLHSSRKTIDYFRICSDSDILLSFLSVVLPPLLVSVSPYRGKRAREETEELQERPAKLQRSVQGRQFMPRGVGLTGHGSIAEFTTPTRSIAVPLVRVPMLTPRPSQCGPKVRSPRDDIDLPRQVRQHFR